MGSIASPPPSCYRMRVLQDLEGRVAKMGYYNSLDVGLVQVDENIKVVNSSSHLIQSQPIWGNQISACRQVWEELKQPTNVEGEGLLRKNKALFHKKLYKVSSMSFHYLCLEDKLYAVHVVS